MCRWLEKEEDALMCASGQRRTVEEEDDSSNLWKRCPDRSEKKEEDTLRVVREGRTAEGEGNSSDVGIDALMLCKWLEKEERLKKEEDVLTLCKWMEKEGDVLMLWRRKKTF